MNDFDHIKKKDEYLDSIISAKTVRSVIKTEFVQAIGTLPADLKILAVEGSSDRCVYYYWLQKEAPQLEYEFFQCGNKNKVLQLFDSLLKDRMNLGDRIYFCVDRDFDDLQGRPNNSRIFMTDKYSIENYLVTSQVLNDILKIEFHCNGIPNIRGRVIELFNRIYQDYLLITRELNYRAYVVSILKFQRIKDYPDRINKISTVELMSVASLDVDPAATIVWQRALSKEEEARLRNDFSMLDPHERYRGKFALCFFIRWLELLRTARESNTSELFSPAIPPENKILGNFTMETLAPKASPPESFRRFIHEVLGLAPQAT